MRASLILGQLDRILLASYLIALLCLLMFPIAGPDFRLLGVGADKWMHIALFGGLAALLRWNLSASRHAILLSVAVAVVVAAATEVAQSLVAYRSAESWDLLAGLLGATLGAISMHRIVSSPVLAKLTGVLVAFLGLMVGTLFGLADVIGVGDSNSFGSLQVAGVVLGALITGGGIGVYLQGIRSESCPS